SGHASVIDSGLRSAPAFPQMLVNHAIGTFNTVARLLAQRISRVRGIDGRRTVRSTVGDQFFRQYTHGSSVSVGRRRTGCGGTLKHVRPAPNGRVAVRILATDTLAIAHFLAPLTFRLAGFS